ncbi:uncharacterized protein LOC108108192 [Drosophila eugracilis]|uniref:uncharacterized protein LOC108108192 n=1 Tax=Drosophila eugracilis TaxID=29029 RepID=UPI0007E6EA60|nr:uncharacterized protein LOC108108192 [Drosophila eugracilis]
MGFFLKVIILTTYLIMKVFCLVEFTNLKCTTLDKDFADIGYCTLKSVNRTYKYVSIKIKLLRVPVTKVKVKFGLYRRLNGYKPFLYNFTVDACKFLKSPNSNPVANYFYGFFKEFSNMNHSCPYDHDIVLDKMTYDSFSHQVTNRLPFPEGRYMIEIHWMAYDINRVITQFYYTISHQS